ncbi:MAG TPA: hypothetical protein VGO93_03560 [Candidatus Xenobia bacterium]|jgi:hypothetical protein
MDFSKDVNELTRFIKDSEAEARDHRKRLESGPATDPKSIDRVREELGDLQTMVRVWLSHMEAVSKYPVPSRLVATSESSFDIHLGAEIVSVFIDSPARMDIRDHTTGVSSMVVYPSPFFNGLTPVLLDAVKREVSRHIRQATLTP